GVLPKQVLVKVAGLRARTVYHYRALAVTPDGTAIGADESFTTSATPVLSGLRMTPRAFRAPVKQRPRPRTTITYTDSRAATTTFVITRCVRSRGRRCTRYSRVGSFTQIDVQGANRIRFNGRIRGRSLPAS